MRNQLALPVLRAAVWLAVILGTSRSTHAQLTLPDSDPISRAFPASVSIKLNPASAVPGDSVSLDVAIQLEPGYHTYDLEQPEFPAVASEITLELPAGLEAVDGWVGSPPQEKFDEVLNKRIFEHHISPSWSQTIRVASGIAAGDYPISGKLRFTVCDEKGCLPPKTEKFLVTLKVASAHDVPLPAPADASAGSAVHLKMDGSEKPAAAAATAEAPSEPKPTVVRRNRQVGSVLVALAFGFLAGLFLNVMPCVLPVISLKVYGFVKQAGEDRYRVRGLGLAFGAGILFVFLVLAGLAAYAGYGWGALFQRDDFVVAMIALMVAFTLGMFDVYVIQLPGLVSNAEAATAQKEGMGASFAKGMLATLLSTPCSGPFLGATVSYALTQPPPVIFAIYAAMGLGMASPYLILTWSPGWMRILPRPGEWMNTFKQFMGFVLLGTAVWLLWQRRRDGELVVWTVAFCIAVSLAVWLYGRMNDPLGSVVRRRLAPIIALIVIAASGYFCFGVMYQPPTAIAAAPSGDGPVAGKWNRFNLDDVLELRAQGKTIIVDWTADW